MALSTIFKKPIDRPIEGVIKADDEAHLQQEVEEYVLTNEVAKRLDAFLAAYNDYQGANGVWISGFFGSGKSHLLKMLALLFDGRTVNGAPVVETFLPKIEDRFLRGDLERALAVPSQSILFNIDQKADVISKTEMDALLAVFVKVFDEMCGYYGKQGYIAQFERDLDSRDQYEDFQRAFEEIAGLPWERGREQALLEAHHIAAAYAQATGAPAESARGILDKYRADYRVSIEDFADQVQAYIERQGPDFHLLFFVDEVGQYIADNIKLMTNLQTVAESLATKSRGRAWLIVTAQEDMNTVFGETGKQQTDDFSKIQARFKTRMKLTSADVEEVIRKRLLAKNARGRAQLAMIYDAQRNNLKTLFDFADGSQTYRNFRDEEHFIQSYPFIPYQFPLFQSAIQSLSQHNAFEGRHSSVGERSMLAVFQQVAIQISDHEMGQLATFDLMFEGIRTALKSQIQHAVSTAEKHLGDPFAVQVLKALFLVKYVKEFKATARNVTVLMLDHFDADLPTLRGRVEEALNLLEQQTYIQRTGEEYEYLTDEEKDVEQEIKNTEVETDAVADELGKLIFDGVIKDRKIRYDENGQDYAFSRKLDDRLLGREYELTIHVISPFHEHAGHDQILRAQAMGRDELLVLMPPSDRLVRDLLMYKRTDKYVRQNMTTAQQETTRRILTEKQIQNTRRYDALRMLVEDLLAEAALVLEGRDLEINSGDPKTRIVKGFHELLVRTYPNLRMLRGIDYTQQDVATFLRPDVTLFGDQAATFSEAEQEVLAFVQGNNRQGLRTTMQSLVNRFEHKPYGWYLAAIQGTVAKLLARGKLEVQRDAHILEGDELERALLNSHGYANLVVEPQIEFTASQLRGLRDFYGEFFDQPTATNEAKALGRETAEAFQDLQEDLITFAHWTDQYPFLETLREPIERLGQVTNQRYTFYLTELQSYEKALFDLKEQVIDPVRRFMKGAQRGIYDEARRFLEREQDNFVHLEGDEADQLRQILADPQVYRGDQMQEAKRLLDVLGARVEARVAEERERIVGQLCAYQERLEQTDEFAALTAEQQSRLRAPFDALAREIERQRLIAVMRDSLRRFQENRYPQLLGQMTVWAAPPLDEPEEVTAGGPVCREPAPEYVSRAVLSVPFAKPWLGDADDVEAYLDALREALLKAIEEGKRVQV
ncbi:MAG TPA: BREX system P-loop protein BrxC [Chloroflexi bacterium]|nr:BREX system P-loop protein BrxC [Chloroflexota bacterium]